MHIVDIMEFLPSENEAASKAPEPEPDTVGSKDTLLVHKKTDSVVFDVIKEFDKRSKIGIKKYGTNLDRTDISLMGWIQHTQEELMDAILYLEKLKKTLQENPLLETEYCV